MQKIGNLDPKNRALRCPFFRKRFQVQDFIRAGIGLHLVVVDDGDQVVQAVVPPSAGASLVAGTVETGGTITLLGSGFVPNEPVVILVTIGESSNLPVRKSLVSAKATATGSLSVDVTFNRDPGLYTLEAIGVSGTLATAPLVVVSDK